MSPLPCQLPEITWAQVAAPAAAEAVGVVEAAAVVEAVVEAVAVVAAGKAQPGS